MRYINPRFTYFFTYLLILCACHLEQFIYTYVVLDLVSRGRPKAEVLLSAENRNRKSSASLMPTCQGPQATVPDADVDSAGSFLGYLYIVSQYTVRLMTPCVWRILYLRNSSSVAYFRQPPNLPTAARRNRMSTESAHLSTFGAEAETEAEIRSTSTFQKTPEDIYYLRQDLL